MQSLLLSLAGPLVPLIAGLITTRLFDYADDVQKWTAGLPDSVKQILVAAIAVTIPVLNAKFGISLPADPAQLLSHTEVQSVVAMVIAFILKGHQQAAAAATP